VINKINSIIIKDSGSVISRVQKNHFRYFGDYIRRDELCDPTKGYLHGNSLVLYCEVSQITKKVYKLNKSIFTGCIDE